MEPWNIAHRGGAALMPENTLAAFAAAVARGADGAELDVQLSRDGVVVVHHDYRLNAGYCRDGNGKWIAGSAPRIKDLTLEELRGFDIGRPDPAGEYARAHPLLHALDGARIPTLEEVIAAVKASSTFLLFVELKSSVRDPSLSTDPVLLADAALAVVRKQNFLERSIFVGFDWSGLMRVKQVVPDARCWFSTAEMKDSSCRPTLGAIAAGGGDGWFADYRDVSAEAIAEAHAAGLKIGAWTVDDPAEMRRLEAAGIDAICTDRPDLMAAL